MKGALAAVLLGLGLAGCASAPRGAASLGLTEPVARACPEGVAAGARCLAGVDEKGAYYWIAVPEAWNGTLVLHAHGGPELGQPKSERAEKDLKRWSIWTRTGYAYAGSSFHQGGVEVRSAAADTERLRHIFSAVVGVPKRTVLHGQSWGAGVAAVAAETYTAADGRDKPYDAVLLTSGVLGGGSLSYDFRLDLRVVYEAVCANHPRPDEPRYPLWEGLPLGSNLTHPELRARVAACTGIDRPVAQRTDAQRLRLQTLLDVIKIPERTLVSHLNWGTWHFQDIVFKRLHGGNPFSNVGVRYIGSVDDDALNAAVARYRADPAAVAAFAADTDPHGRIPVPVLTVHAIDDPTAFVELESTWRETMERAGTSDHLVQLFTNDHDHSYLSDAAYVTAIDALLAWVGGGPKPTSQQIAVDCHAIPARFDPVHGCRFVPAYTPPPLSNRVPSRAK